MTVPYPSQLMFDLTRKPLEVAEDRVLGLFMDGGEPLTVGKFEIIWGAEFERAGGDLSKLMDDLTLQYVDADRFNDSFDEGISPYQVLLITRPTYEAKVTRLQQCLEQCIGDEVGFQQKMLLDDDYFAGKTSYRDTINWLDASFPSHKKAVAVLMAASAWNMSLKEMRNENYRSIWVFPLLMAVFEYVQRMTGRDCLPWSRVSTAPLHGHFNHIVRANDLIVRGHMNVARLTIESMARQAAQFCRDYVVVRARLADKPCQRTIALMAEHLKLAEREKQRKAADDAISQSAAESAALAAAVDRNTMTYKCVRMDLITRDRLQEMIEIMDIKELETVFMCKKLMIDRLLKFHGLGTESSKGRYLHRA